MKSDQHQPVKGSAWPHVCTLSIGSEVHRVVWPESFSQSQICEKRVDQDNFPNQIVRDQSFFILVFVKNIAQEERQHLSSTAAILFHALFHLLCRTFPGYSEPFSYSLAIRSQKLSEGSSLQQVHMCFFIFKYLTFNRLKPLSLTMNTDARLTLH